MFFKSVYGKCQMKKLAVLLLSIVLITTAVFLTGCSCSTDKHPLAAVQTTQLQTSSGELGFSMTTTTKDGITAHAMAEPNMLTFLMEGNIRPGRGMPMIGFYMHSKELTQEQIQQREQLLASSGYFVAPIDVKLKPHKRRCRAIIRFRCMGEEDMLRRIELNAQLKDAKGDVLVTMKRVCCYNFEDNVGGRHFFAINTERFNFDSNLVEDVKQISITLKEL